MAQEAGLQVIEDKLMRFVNEELLDEDLDEGADPLTGEAVDSLGLEQLVEHIASEFGVAIAEEEMIARNFASISALAALIVSRRHGTA